MWGRVLILSADESDDAEFSRIKIENTQTVRSTVTEREAQEGIHRDIAGEWTEWISITESFALLIG